MTNINLNDLKGEANKIRTYDGEEIAKWLHLNYEKFSEEDGWTTQKKCQVDFDDLPEKNKIVMLKMGTCILQRFILPLLLRIDELKQEEK